MNGRKKVHPDPYRPSNRTLPQKIGNVSIDYEKILTEHIREEIYYPFINSRLFSEERNGGHKVMYYTLINTSSRKVKREGRMLLRHGLTKIAYDMIQQSWIINYPKMYKISDKIIKFIMETVNRCEEKLTARENLSKEKIQRRIFQGDAVIITICICDHATLF